MSRHCVLLYVSVKMSDTFVFNSSERYPQRVVTTQTNVYCFNDHFDGVFHANHAINTVSRFW